MVGTVNNFDIYIYFYNESKTLITVEKYGLYADQITKKGWNVLF